MQDNANLLKIPPLKSAKGHLLNDWGKTIVWSGVLKVMAQDEDITLHFMNKDGTIFAKSPIPRDSEKAL